MDDSQLPAEMRASDMLRRKAYSLLPSTMSRMAARSPIALVNQAAIQYRDRNVLRPK
jgi:hypothetical protein